MQMIVACVCVCVHIYIYMYVTRLSLYVLVHAPLAVAGPVFLNVSWLLTISADTRVICMPSTE